MSLSYMKNDEIQSLRGENVTLKNRIKHSKPFFYKQRFFSAQPEYYLSF